MKDYESVEITTPIVTYQPYRTSKIVLFLTKIAATQTLSPHLDTHTLAPSAVLPDFLGGNRPSLTGSRH
jgi:hypothetical protein